MTTVATHRPVPRQVLTVPEVAQALGISRSLAYQLIASGQLPHIRLGKRIVIPRSSINRILERADFHTTDE